MNKSTILLFLIIIVFESSESESEVQEYVDLIEEEIAKAFANVLPQDASDYKPFSNFQSVYGVFDYIIVGAGGAGAVIANRLSEDGASRVLLIEAGSHETRFTDIPSMSLYLQGLHFNWNYNTTRQTDACLSLFNSECPYPRGKVLGGSTTINTVIYARGNKIDFNNWARMGNPGWSYKDVLPLFKRAEHSQIDGDPGYHGHNGNLFVEYAHIDFSPQFDAFIEANLELGRKVVDYNGREQLGVSATQFNLVGGTRDSTGKGYLVPAANRTNLDILTGCLATKILITPISKTAYGVSFSCKDNPRTSLTAFASKEVIVSGGAFNSPQLLMLSGIGPRSHLQKLNIPVIKALPVGENLQEHPAYYGLSFVTNYTAPVLTLEQTVRRYLKGFGPLAVPQNIQGIGFFQSKLENIPGLPDVELLFVPSNSTSDFLQKSYHYKELAYNITFASIDPLRTCSIFVILLRPRSRGYVRLKSKDPYEFPIINPKLLSDPNGEDIERLYQGIQIVLEIVNTSAFKKLNASLRYAPLPMCKQYPYLSKAFWYCQIRQISIHTHHPVGTCKMGPDPATGAVVDHELKVYGINNLRVADASIIPEIISGHTSAVATMIGEKASDLIRKGS